MVINLFPCILFFLCTKCMFYPCLKKSSFIHVLLIFLFKSTFIIHPQLSSVIWYQDRFGWLPPALELLLLLLLLGPRALGIGAWAGPWPARFMWFSILGVTLTSLGRLRGLFWSWELLPSTEATWPSRTQEVSCSVLAGGPPGGSLSSLTLALIGSPSSSKTLAAWLPFLAGCNSFL